jgi:hypothetical protein
MKMRLAVILAAELLITVAAAQTREPARCPCVDPTPEQANLNPAKFAGDYSLHVCAFHIAKDDPWYQIETHHYCTAARGAYSSAPSTTRIKAMPS